MKYRKVKVEFTEAPDRLNRYLLVKENLNLLELGTVILTSMCCDFYHCFEFRCNGNRYVPYSFLEQSWGNNDFPMVDTKYVSLDEKFSLTYDLGDCWEFNITVSTDTLDLPDTKDTAIWVDGKGIGLWEDRKILLLEYYNNKINPKTRNTKANAHLFPININLRYIGEQDTKISFVAGQSLLLDVDKNLRMIKKVEKEAKEYIKSL